MELLDMVLGGEGRHNLKELAGKT